MNEPVTDFELQRLLDGSLSQEERNLLLRSAEDNPANWRLIALAFWEEQILRQQLGDLMKQPDQSDRPAPIQDSGRSHPWLKVVAQTAAIGAMLVTAIWLGRISAGQPGDMAVASKSAGDYTIVLAPGAPPPSQAQSQDPTTVGNQQDNPDAFQRMLTPIFDRRSQSMFRDHGYLVNEESVIYVVQGDEGEQYVVPRRNVSFVANHE